MSDGWIGLNRTRVNNLQALDVFKVVRITRNQNKIMHQAGGRDYRIAKPQFFVLTSQQNGLFGNGSIKGISGKALEIKSLEYDGRLLE